MFTAFGLSNIGSLSLPHTTPAGCPQNVHGHLLPPGGLSANNAAKDLRSSTGS